MSRARQRSPGVHHARRSAATSNLLDNVLLCTLAAVFCARPLISESFERVELSFLGLIAPAGGPTLLATIGMDTLLAIVVALVWMRSGVRSRGVFGIGAILLAAAVIVSTLAADDRRAAANASAHILIVVLAGGALLRVVRTRAAVHLLLAGLIAGGCVNAVKCITQRAYEFDQTLEVWNQQKQRLASEGVDLTAPHFQDYERRLKSAQAFGYLAHPNVTAACMVPGLLLSFALLCTWRRRNADGTAPHWPAALIAAVLLLTIASGLPLTGSNGALLSAGVGASAMLLWVLMRRRLASRANRMFAVLAGGYLLVCAAGAAYGLAKHTLPHPSLAFRWQYWTAAEQAYRDKPLAGMGRENFIHAYVRYKTPQSTEEVRNPHNIWVSLLVELGPLGLASGVLLLAAALFWSVRASGIPETGPALETVAAPPGGDRLLPAACIAGILVCQGFFSATEFAQPGIGFIWAVELAGLFATVFALALLALQSVQRQRAGAGFMAAGCAAALLAGLLHNLIGFSLITPAGLSVFVTTAVCGIALCRIGDASAAPTGGGTDRPTPRRRVLSVGLGATLLVAYAALVAFPSLRSARALGQFRATVAGLRDPSQIAAVARAADHAVAADGWDASTPRAIARMTVPLSISASLAPQQRLALLDIALRMAETSAERNPSASGAYRLLARIEEQRASALRALSDQTESAVATRRAAAYWESAVALYPTNPRTRIDAAGARYRLWQSTHDDADARIALRHLQAALDIDARRAAGTTAKLRSEELQTIDALRNALTSDD